MTVGCEARRTFVELSSLKVLRVLDAHQHFRVKAVGVAEPVSCWECSSPLYRHGRNRQSFMDVPVSGKHVVIDVDRRRYRCRVCGKTFFECLPDMDGRRLATRRLITYI